ncbi:MAG: type II toxin-antitoxin system RelE/ParE family toxin, partial [Thaumarchaeota archaeon]|nr:type II toxin-antitoxin system RelE/ParE family toxin [Nitrososphaerota archaeon]
IRELDEKISGRVAYALGELQKGFSARLDIKKMKGYHNHYRIRVGDYRILFELRQGKTVVVYDVLPRKKAYD